MGRFLMYHAKRARQTARVTRAVTTAGLLAVGILMTTPPVEAQFTGVPGGDGASSSANRAQFYAHVVLKVNDVMSEWREAWAKKDLDALLDLYTPGATLIIGDEDLIKGTDALRERLAVLLGATGEIQAAMSDFEASGRMGMVTGLLTLELKGTARNQTIRGLHVSVFMREKRDWKIRSQLFRIDTYDEPLPGAPPATSGAN